jgi:hypothetical protein
MGTHLRQPGGRSAAEVAVACASGIATDETAARPPFLFGCEAGESPGRPSCDRCVAAPPNLARIFELRRYELVRAWEDLLAAIVQYNADPEQDDDGSEWARIRELETMIEAARDVDPVAGADRLDQYGARSARRSRRSARSFDQDGVSVMTGPAFDGGSSAPGRSAARTRDHSDG